MPWIDCTARHYSCTKLPGVKLSPLALGGGLLSLPAARPRTGVLRDSTRSKPDLVRPAEPRKGWPRFPDQKQAEPQSQTKQWRLTT